uniref:Uncharacterized protein n=1 Tax=Timema douglasi TaxID=61478 RepID=A0A7R8VTU4_TIMDO|nr:unnamed protein product [Timema douglasi]
MITVDRPKSRTFPDCIAVLEYIDKVLEFVLQPVPSCRRSMTPETEKVVFAVYVCLSVCLHLRLEPKPFYRSGLSLDESLMDKNGTGCKILAVLVLISANSMFAMMLLEAVFLHRLIAAAFKAEPNMKILYCFAAGQIMFATVAATFRAPYFYISSKQTPVEAEKLQKHQMGVIHTGEPPGPSLGYREGVVTIFPVVAWIILRATKEDTDCWSTDDNGYQWINDGTRITLLAINTLLMADIIRVLLTKLKAVKSWHSDKIR